MKNLISKIKNIKKQTVIKNSFLLPILLVVFISISHVVSWYDIGNPLSWAIYLSVAIEIFALASVAAASINVSRASVWTLFGLVTSIQIIGNIFFVFQDINVNSTAFLAWVELTKPLFVDWDITDHRRLLSYIQGGTLPAMSLIALHYYIKFNDIENAQKSNKKETPIIKTKPFPKDILEKIYHDHSNVDPNDLPQGTNRPTNYNDYIDEYGTFEINEFFDSSKWFDANEVATGTKDALDEIQIKENQESVKPNDKSLTDKDKSIETPDENVIVEKITKTSPNNADATQSQWAGGSKGNFQNPQAMPGVN